MFHAGSALIDPHFIFTKVGLASGMRVADLGCGRTGHFIFSAARTVEEKGIVYAVDVLKDVLENVKSRTRSEGYDNVQTVWSDIETVGNTAIPTASLDGCFIINVMFLMKNRVEAATEAARLLKPGGFLAVVEWLKNLGEVGPSPQDLISPEELKATIAKSGLVFHEECAVGEYHYALTFKKISV